MERLWIIWIVFGYLVNVGDTLLQALCQREGYFQTVHENYRLKNYVISSTDVQSLFDCVMACTNEERCSSYNFQVSGNPLHKCELNSRSQSSAKPGSMELSNGFQYYEEVVRSEKRKVCESVSCFNGGSCEEKCVGFPYSQCRCPKGYTGIYCEKLESGKPCISHYITNTGGLRRGLTRQWTAASVSQVLGPYRDRSYKIMLLISFGICMVYRTRLALYQL